MTILEPQPFDDHEPDNWTFEIVPGLWGTFDLVIEEMPSEFISAHPVTEDEREDIDAGAMIELVGDVVIVREQEITDAPLGSLLPPEAQL